jgi:hypothetical protein
MKRVGDRVDEVATSISVAIDREAEIGGRG